MLEYSWLIAGVVTLIILIAAARQRKKAKRNDYRLKTAGRDGNRVLFREGLVKTISRSSLTLELRPYQEEIFAGIDNLGEYRERLSRYKKSKTRVYVRITPLKWLFFTRYTIESVEAHRH